MSKKHDKDESGSRQEVVASKVTSAYETAREKASTVAHEAVSGMEANPLGTLLGGIALGAAVGALIPRGDRERSLLAPLGERLASALREALSAGRAAGLEALDGSTLNLDNLRDQIGGLVSASTQAAGSAGLAAFRGGKSPTA